MLFERICRENGIAQRLTRPRSPTTTGKIERLHQTLQQELLNVHNPFTTIEDAQAAVDAWRQEYNADRPHQSLNMAFPASRFKPATSEILGLRIPAELATAQSARLADQVDVPPASGPDLAPAHPGGPAPCGKTADVTIEAGAYQVTVSDGVALTAPRRASREIRRHKASNYATSRPPEGPGCPA